MGHSVHRRGVSEHALGQTHPPGQTYSSMHWGRHPPGQTYPSIHRGRHPPGRHIPACTGVDSPWALGQTTPWADISQHALGQTPLGRHIPACTGTDTPHPSPPDGHCSGRYASYWNDLSEQVSVDHKHVEVKFREVTHLILPS